MSVASGQLGSDLVQNRIAMNLRWLESERRHSRNIFKLMPAVLNSFKCVIIKLNHKFVSFSYKRNHIGSDLCDKDENLTPFIFKWGEDSCFSFVTAWRIIKSSFHFLLVCSSSFDSFNLSNKINNKYLCRNFNRWYHFWRNGSNFYFYVGFLKAYINYDSK